MDRVKTSFPGMVVFFYLLLQRSPPGRSETSPPLITTPCKQVSNGAADPPPSPARINRFFFPRRAPSPERRVFSRGAFSPPMCIGVNNTSRPPHKNCLPCTYVNGSPFDDSPIVCRFPDPPSPGATPVFPFVFNETHCPFISEPTCLKTSCLGDLHKLSVVTATHLSSTIGTLHNNDLVPQNARFL